MAEHESFPVNFGNTELDVTEHFFFKFLKVVFLL